MVEELSPILGVLAIVAGLFSVLTYLVRKGSAPTPTPTPPPLPDVHIVEKELAIEQKAHEEREAVLREAREQEQASKELVARRADSADTPEKVVELLKEVGKR